MYYIISVKDLRWQKKVYLKIEKLSYSKNRKRKQKKKYNDTSIKERIFLAITQTQGHRL